MVVVVVVLLVVAAAAAAAVVVVDKSLQRRITGVTSRNAILAMFS